MQFSFSRLLGKSGGERESDPMSKYGNCVMLHDDLRGVCKYNFSANFSVGTSTNLCIFERHERNEQILFLRSSVIYRRCLSMFLGIIDRTPLASQSSSTTTSEDAAASAASKGASRRPLAARLRL